MSFDYRSADSQGTLVEPINPKDFDIDEYCEYESLLLDRCRKFWEGNSGVLVYRRFRVPEVFSYGCRDMKRSLELQLAALKESMKYKADIPNFLNHGMELAQLQVHLVQIIFGMKAKHQPPKQYLLP